MGSQQTLLSCYILIILSFFSTWVRTTLLRIAELEAALDRSNVELQAVRIFKKIWIFQFHFLTMTYSFDNHLPFHFLIMILLQLRKQNREMEQTLEIVDEENAKIRREMERTNTQLSTFATWVEKRELL